MSVLIAGLGVSGIEAANLYLSQGESVILYDGNVEKNKEEILAKLVKPAEIVLGDLTEEILQRISYCIISPGISLEVPFAVALQERGIEIRSEIEASYQYEQGTVIGITGTNGKTTTTTLVGDIMKAYLGQDKAFTVGNIGTPYSRHVLETSKASVTTIELSSFQLETVSSFHPHVAAILNITPDHLNRHHTMECYTEVKAKVSKNQTADDFLILNYSDERLRKVGESGLLPKVLWFSGKEKLQDGYYLKGNQLVKAVNGADEVYLTTEETSLVGVCNYENILAAIAMTEAMGVPKEIILKTIRSFKAVSHRIEFVRELNGVKYYDDSKGTNTDAAIQGIKAMTSKTVLIGGGYDKGSEFDDWILAFDGKIKKLLLMGVTKEKIAKTAEKYGFTNYQFVDSLQEAVDIAYSLAEPGENVLLSPACASWDMFKSYEQRGDLFKEMVRALK